MQIFEGQMRKPNEGDIVIVVAKFNRTITDRLLEGALAKLRECGIDEENITVVRVPGTFEIPVVAERFADIQNVTCIICLGAVIKGETTHDEHINRAVSLEIAKTATNSGKPVIFGILTCDTLEQAIARSGGAAASHDKADGKDAYVGNKGYEAAEAALEMINLLHCLPQSDNAAPWDALSNMFTQALMGGQNDSDGLYDTPFDFDDDDDDWNDDDDNDFDHSSLMFLPGKKAVKKSAKKASKKSSKKRKGK
jgi:6,7-dimethyl-8-ribityllumazine synthase